MVGVNMGFHNPMFAYVEVDYKEADPLGETAERTQKALAFYELDLGLNHVRQYPEPLEEM